MKKKIGSSKPMKKMKMGGGPGDGPGDDMMKKGVFSPSMKEPKSVKNYPTFPVGNPKSANPLKKEIQPETKKLSPSEQRMVDKAKNYAKRGGPVMKMGGAVKKSSKKK